MTGFGGRLRDSLAIAGLSVREFQRRLEEQNVLGSSLPAVHRYLTDKTSPSVEWASAAARLVRVRLAWLLAGEGSASVSDDIASPKRADFAEVALEDAPEWIPSGAKGQFMALAYRYGAFLIEKDPNQSPFTTVDRLESVVARIMRMIEEEFGRVPIHAKEEAVVLICLALSRAMPPSRQDRIEAAAQRQPAQTRKQKPSRRAK